jgi:secreted trypsin-like serine protease
VSAHPKIMVKIGLLFGLITALLNANANGKLIGSGMRDNVKRTLRGNETQELIGNVMAQIIGGLAAPKGFFSHQVSFVDGDSKHYCGGSLIANNVVLGAAHCVHDEEGTYIGKKVMKNHRVHVNKYYRFSDNDGMEVLRICAISVHEDYNWETNDYDFVLYKLCTGSYLAKKGEVVPIKINRKKTLPTYQQVLTATGWGSTSNSPVSKPDELQMVNVNYIDTVSCTTSPFKYSKNAITKSMMCSGALVGGGRSSCSGDSGGPLMIQGTDKKKHLLVGLASWHKGDCATEGYPSVYARVSYVIDWIEDKACSWIKGSCTIKTN